MLLYVISAHSYSRQHMAVELMVLRSNGNSVIRRECNVQGSERNILYERNVLFTEENIRPPKRHLKGIWTG
jgi:hypothetical protein